MMTLAPLLSVLLMLTGADPGEREAAAARSAMAAALAASADERAATAVAAMADAAPVGPVPPGPVPPGPGPVGLDATDRASVCRLARAVQARLVVVDAGRGGDDDLALAWLWADGIRRKACVD